MTIMQFFSINSVQIQSWS